VDTHDLGDAVTVALGEGVVDSGVAAGSVRSVMSSATVPSQLGFNLWNQLEFYGQFTVNGVEASSFRRPPSGFSVNP
jgi:hypothetical protein